MASWAEDAALLDDADRLRVLSLYRQRRREGHSPGSALRETHHVLAVQCMHAVLDGDLSLALRRAHQCSYEMVLLQNLHRGESPALVRLRSL